MALKWRPLKKALKNKLFYSSWTNFLFLTLVHIDVHSSQSFEVLWGLKDLTALRLWLRLLQLRRLFPFHLSFLSEAAALSMKGFDGRDDEDDAWIFIARVALFQVLKLFYLLMDKILNSVCRIIYKNFWLNCWVEVESRSRSNEHLPPKANEWFFVTWPLKAFCLSLGKVNLGKVKVGDQITCLQYNVCNNQDLI